MSHNFIRTEGKDEYKYTIHCTKCGYVSWHGSYREESLTKMQVNIPDKCSEDDSLDRIERYMSETDYAGREEIAHLRGEHKLTEHK